MTLFQQFIFIYFISATALAGFAVLWRNWLEDHPNWKDWLHVHAKAAGKALTCGSCFTYWLTLVFVALFNPLRSFAMPIFFTFNSSVSHIFFYAIEWMSLAWGALFLRFLYVFLQESVSRLVHERDEHHH
jgi:hypothetical protein